MKTIVALSFVFIFVACTNQFYHQSHTSIPWSVSEECRQELENYIKINQTEDLTFKGVWKRDDGEIFATFMTDKNIDMKWGILLIIDSNCRVSESIPLK